MSDIFSQSESTIFQKILELLYSIWYFLLPTGAIGVYLLTKKIQCKCINSVIQIHGNSCIRVDTYEITKPLIAVFSESIPLPTNFKNLNISYSDTDRRDILKRKNNILTPNTWHLKSNSKTKVVLQYEWFPEKQELYITSQDEPQVLPNEIVTNYTVTNCSNYYFQNLELSVNLPLNTDIDPNNFNPKFLEIIDVVNNNQKIQKRATKISLLRDDLVHKLEVSWEAEIEAKETKTFEIHYKFNNV